MGLLTEVEYLATMGTTRDLQPEEVMRVDLGGYLESVPVSDCQGFNFLPRRVARVVSINDGSWQHVLLAADDTPNVFLVIVINGFSEQVHGHHLLNLNRLYGLNDQ